MVEQAHLFALYPRKCPLLTNLDDNILLDMGVTAVEGETKEERKKMRNDLKRLLLDCRDCRIFDITEIVQRIVEYRRNALKDDSRVLHFPPVSAKKKASKN